MREKELRLALICYGGISLAVYMHGITKEVWRLARASRAFHAREPADGNGSEAVYRRLLQALADECELDLRVIVDILTGASAGGINAIFLADAVATGRSLEPLTDLWLEVADVDTLIDPGVSAVSRFAKAAAALPFAWAMSRRGDTVEQTVEAGHRDEVRHKLANFVRARWFAPPFSGPGFTELILNAFDAMATGPASPPLLPAYQPLDLFVTVTDFRGHPERLRLHSPPEAMEREHRITLSFRKEAGVECRLADRADLVFAARATASFPGAFPPFQVRELDAVLEERRQPWPGRETFLARVLPRHVAIGDVESAVLIDGSILANAPFRPAMQALRHRPARREVDRRFVYIDPKPGERSVRLTDSGRSEPPGFFATLFGALSDIPREQPIRDNLEAIERRSSRIRRLTRIVAAMRPEVEAAIERSFGATIFLLRPTPKRLAGWRSRAQTLAARGAGFAYAGYAQLKLSTVVEEMAEALLHLAGGGGRGRRESFRQALWGTVRARGLAEPEAATAAGASEEMILFLRNFDLPFRVRRLRFLTRRLAEMEEPEDAPRQALRRARETVYDFLARYQGAAACAADDPAFAATEAEPERAMAALAAALDLKAVDDEADARLTEVLAEFPRAERRSLILAYLGFPFYDIATLPLLQGEGLDEFDPVKVDRISPEDATAIREGGAEATLKGIQFNSFGAFFSRAYRENDYLWGRLHGADRLIDIIVSALPEGMHLPPGMMAGLKRDIFRAILAEEKERLTTVPGLFEELEREVG
ncbi:MAG TPA: patatin-like protein [Allosphingosinicella sp.]|jgi:patatin-related protein